MARARSVVSDQSSAEFDELRKQFNGLLVVLENIATSVDAGSITADEAFTVLKTVLNGGSDISQENVDGGSNDYVGTNREIVGVKATPQHPRRPRNENTVELDADSDF